MKLKDAIKILNQNNGQHIDQIYIPSAGRNIMFKPLTTADVKTLTRNNLFDAFDLNVELLKLGLFDKLLNEDLSSEGINCHTITQLDYLAFLIGMRQMLDNNLSYTFTCRKCDKKFKHVVKLNEEFGDIIRNFEPKSETLELTDESGQIYKFEMENFTMEQYLYYRYTMNKLKDHDQANPDVINENVYTRPILYVKKIFINDEEIEDWTNALFPHKLSLFNSISPSVTIGPAKDGNDTSVSKFVADTFIEEELDKKIRALTVTCPSCKQEYRGIFSFDGFFTF